MADIQLTPEEDVIYQQLLTYYAMGDVATEDVEGYIYDGIRMRGRFEGTSIFADRIEALVNDAQELPEVDGESALERIGEKIEAVGPTLPSKPTVGEIRQGLAKKERRGVAVGLTPGISSGPAAIVAQFAATGKKTGGKTRKGKSKSKSKQLRKTRKYSRRH